jgi:hypothetical protein
VKIVRFISAAYLTFMGFLLPVAVDWVGPVEGDDAAGIADSYCCKASSVVANSRFLLFIIFQSSIGWEGLINQSHELWGGNGFHGIGVALGVGKVHEIGLIRKTHEDGADLA